MNKSILFKNLFVLIIFTCYINSAISQNIVCGDGHTLVICTNGTANAWGDNLYFQLGTGSSANAYNAANVILATDIIAVAAGEQHSHFLKNNGTVYACGTNTYGQVGVSTVGSPQIIPGLSNVIAISSGIYHSMILKSDNTVWTFGNNSDGQLGDSTLTNSNIPVQVHNLTDVKALLQEVSIALH